jgi:putative addiction module component (TIGR02574 family)
MSENLIDRILKLPVDERLGLIERIWDSIGVELEVPPVRDEDRAELDRRLGELAAGETAE